MMVVAGAFAALVALVPANAATQPDWVVTDRLELSGRSATRCYDRRSLRNEATGIRVRVRSDVADHPLPAGCPALTGGVAGSTFESEILVRCRDRMWTQTVDARGHRLADPVSEAQWRSARGSEHQAVVDRLCADAPGPADPGSAKAPGRPASGTGFFVDDGGHLLTNDHVVATCRQVSVVAAGERWPAEIVARDGALDLALLKVGTPSTAYASFRIKAPPRAGETVTAAGFPLRGLLASGPIVSTGIVNAVAGIRDDTTRFQISAPVQPGNSGGPVLDASGNVIGVVVSKLDAVKLAQSTGDMPQNVNFAIKGESARAFLQQHRVSPRTGTWSRPIDPVGVAAIAKAMTVPVDCR